MSKRKSGKKADDDRYCRKGHVMPDDLTESEQKLWGHKETEVTYVGAYFKTVQCKHCGKEWQCLIV